MRTPRCKVAVILLVLLSVTLWFTYTLSQSQQNEEWRGDFIQREEAILRKAAPEIFLDICPHIPVYGGLRAIQADRCYIIYPPYELETENDARTQALLEEHFLNEKLSHDDIKEPIILWWTDFTHETGRMKKCGEVSCYLTNNRAYKNHPLTKAFMFYGTSVELHDLPLPRQPHHEWALLHEESPKNNWAYSSPYMISLFNHTATFKRESDYPITLQWLTSIEDIESRQYYYTVEEKNAFMRDEGLAPIAYIQSDCGAPSDRDNLVEMMSKHIKIDNLGQCLHNKDLPENISNNLKGMLHKDFYKLLSKYKFIMAAENAICDDYITEKLWRTYYVGSVPIIFGSPRIKDLIPTPQSSIIAQEYSDVISLVQKIEYLNTHDDAYSEATNYKSTGGVTNPKLLQMMSERVWGIDNDPTRINFIDGFQCHVCKQMHDMNRQPKHATNDHWGCPEPRKLKGQNDLFGDTDEDFWWVDIFRDSMMRADSFRQLIKEEKYDFTQMKLEKMILQKKGIKHIG